MMGCENCVHTYSKLLLKLDQTIVMKANDSTHTCNKTPLYSCMYSRNRSSRIEAINLMSSF